MPKFEVFFVGEADHREHFGAKFADVLNGITKLGGELLAVDEVMSSENEDITEDELDKINLDSLPFNPADFTAKELGEKVKDLDDPDVLEALLKAEIHGENRDNASYVLKQRRDALLEEEEEED